MAKFVALSVCILGVAAHSQYDMMEFAQMMQQYQNNVNQQRQQASYEFQRKNAEYRALGLDLLVEQVPDNPFQASQVQMYNAQVMQRNIEVMKERGRRGDRNAALWARQEEARFNQGMRGAAAILDGNLENQKRVASDNNKSIDLMNNLSERGEISKRLSQGETKIKEARTPGELKNSVKEQERNLEDYERNRREGASIFDDH